MSLLPHYTSKSTAFLCIDLQAPFQKRIANFCNCVFVANRFARLHEILPDYTKYVITEQYPKVFGPTVAEVILPSTVRPVPKMRFSAFTKEVQDQLGDAQHIVVFGIESHVCVIQTVEDLLRDDRTVYLALDGLGSQKKSDFDAAIALMRTWGRKCVVSTSESLLLQFARTAEDANFKSIAKLLKDQPPSESW